MEEHKNEEQLEQVSTQDADDTEEYEKICFVCRRPESKTGKMVCLPNNICILSAYLF